MYIRDFLDRLHVDRGPNASGEYMCRCPAHQDRTASLSVRTGDDGNLLVKCMAGCDTRDVVKAMGLTMRDLFNSTDAQPARPAPMAKDSRAGKSLGELKKVYSYRDENGRELFQVCRYEKMEDGKREKTFRQRRYAPEDPKAKGDGYVWSISGVRNVIYHLPEVRLAIEAGQTIYLVEGEKDADTLARLGLCATTNAGGAVKSGSVKWTEEHSEMLRGARRVVILPDNDEVGRSDRQQVALSVAMVCDDVRLLDLRGIDPELPEKGDITDLLERMGDDAGLKALRQAVDDAACVDQVQIRDMKARALAMERINALDGYCVDEGCISQQNDNSVKKLCTFSGLVTGILEQDDGATVIRSMVIDAWRSDGRKLPRVTVKAGEFSRMNWVEGSWDVQAAILPGTTQRDKVRYVMSQAGAASVERVTEYGHTGWRNVGGRWCYLYQGGAIGADDVRVKLSGNLERYRMDDGADTKTPEDELLARASMITGAVPRRISVPMTGLCFLAPLRDALERAGCAPSFVTFLRGGTGIGKSTISALWMNYYGTQFGELNMVATYSDTINSLRRKAFCLKDTVMIIDDYHPEGNLQAKRRMEDTAQQLVRAFGDLAGRDRMSAEGGIAGTPPPRSLALTSGEDMPNVRESGQARYYTIDLRKGDVPLWPEDPGHERLVDMQELAREGGLARMMRRYIEWLIPQMPGLPARLRKRWQEMREIVQEQKLGHARSAGAVAHLLLGYEMYLRFLLEEGVIPEATQDWCSAEMRDAIRDVMANAEAQGREAREERPTAMYIGAIVELLRTKVVYVEDLVPGGEDAPRGRPLLIGYRDEFYYYLLPMASYNAVYEQYNRRGEVFPLSSRMLNKQLVEDGIIRPDKTGGKNTRNKIIHGKPVRLLWIPRERIDGKPAGEVQMEFKEVRGEENPFEDKKGGT